MPSSTRCSRVTGSSRKEPQDTQAAPHLLSTGCHHLCKTRGRLRRAVQRVPLGRLSPAPFLTSMGFTSSQHRSQKCVTPSPSRTIRSSGSPASWHFREDSLGPASHSGQSQHPADAPAPGFEHTDVSTDEGPACTGNTVCSEDFPGSKASRQPRPKPPHIARGGASVSQSASAPEGWQHSAVFRAPHCVREDQPMGSAVWKHPLHPGQPRCLAALMTNREDLGASAASRRLSSQWGRGSDGQDQVSEVTKQHTTRTDTHVTYTRVYT